MSPILVLANGGVQFKGLFIPWRLFYILSGIILFFGAYLTFKWIRARKEGLKGKFLKEIKEAKKEIEDVKKFRERIREFKELEERAENEEEELKKELWGKKESQDKLNHEIH